MYSSLQEAISCIQSSNKVFIHTGAAAPQKLIQALIDQAERLRNVQLYQLHTEGPAPYADEKFQESFFVNAFFVGANVRDAINSERGSYIPIFLSEAAGLFCKEIIELDVALVMVSPPDKHGFCSLGTSIDISKAAVDEAKIVIAQVNPLMPRTHGDGIIHINEINYLVEGVQELPEIAIKPCSEIELQIGRHIAEKIEDGSTLQMGIGAIPNAVLKSLEQHKDLGIHTEMFSDGILPLVEKGVITGKHKVKHPGMIVSSFVVGSRKLYDFIDDNPTVKMLSAEYVNNVNVISRNPKVVAINSAIEIDLSGQVCADSIGSRIYSGVGGQMDFIRGASISPGGKPIIALPSRTKDGTSRITAQLKPGAGVVTTRAHVHWVCTEYGIVNLYGKSLEQRAELLISLAHPDDRERLLRQLHNNL
jgi:4-hydroxybutyrate CoA-transferase